VPDEDLRFSELESSVERMEQMMLMGRNLREKMKVKAKIPLKSMTLIHRDPAVLESLKKLESYFVEELNVREVRYEDQEDRLVQISTQANFPRLGKRLGKKMKEVAGGIQKFTLEQILVLEKGQTLEVAGEVLTHEDIEIRRAPKAGVEFLLSHQLISLQLDPTVEEDQIQEGLFREVVRRIQMARKSADLRLDQRIHLQIDCEGELKVVVEKFSQEIQDETLALSLTHGSSEKGAFREESEIDGNNIIISII